MLSLFTRKKVPFDKLDATRDAASIWKMIRESEKTDWVGEDSNLDSIDFKKIAYNKLTTSKDNYTRQVLGTNTFSELDPLVKKRLISVMAYANVADVENGKIALLELAKMVSKQGKKLDYITIDLVEDLIEQGKIKCNDIFNPVWLNNPKIWEQKDPFDRSYLIKLKIFLDSEFPLLWCYVDKNYQGLDDAVGGEDSLSMWKTLINKYDSVNKLQAYLGSFVKD